MTGGVGGEPTATCLDCGQQVTVEDGTYAPHDRIPPRAVACVLSGARYEGPAHTIAWFLERDRVVGRFSCAVAAGGLCRAYCPRSSCEEGCVDPDGHEWVAQDECTFLTYVDMCGEAAEHHGGTDEVPVRDGEVCFTWDGSGCFTWVYAESSVG